jgi:hypothetical protein
MTDSRTRFVTATWRSPEMAWTPPRKSLILIGVPDGI